MKKFLTSSLLALLLSTSLNANNNKTVQFDTTKGEATIGLKLYNNKIKQSCNFTNELELASKHSQDEWQDIAQSGNFRSEITEICSGLDDSIKDSWLTNLYQFVYENANDSGVVPWNFYM
jgi:hypothetical protein